MFRVHINNCPEYAKKYKYIIARNDAGSLWFYGAFDDKDDVDRIVNELGDGAVIINNE